MCQDQAVLFVTFNPVFVSYIHDEFKCNNLILELYIYSRIIMMCVIGIQFNQIYLDKYNKN
jgi:hypothetical protein